MLTSHKKGKEKLIKMHTHSIRNRSTCFLFLNTCTSTTTCMLIYIGCVCKEKKIFKYLMKLATCNVLILSNSNSKSWYWNQKIMVHNFNRCAWSTSKKMAIALFKTLLSRRSYILLPTSLIYRSRIISLDFILTSHLRLDDHWFTTLCLLIDKLNLGRKAGQSWFYATLMGWHILEPF